MNNNNPLVVEADRTILLEVRLPRVLLAAVIGAALSSAGVVFQALLRNPLADPYVLGVSGGASIGGVIALTLIELPRLAQLLPQPPINPAIAGWLRDGRSIQLLAHRFGSRVVFCVTGAFGPLVTPIVAGHEAYWANVNANGGIHGLDDPAPGRPHRVLEIVADRVAVEQRRPSTPLPPTTAAAIARSGCPAQTGDPPRT